MVVIASLLACDAESDAPSKVALADAEDVFERAYCERMFSCRCEQGRYFESIAACMDLVRIQVDQLRDVPPMAGVTYDPRCLGERKDQLDELGCDATTAEPDASCVAPCQPWHGALGVGASCRSSDDGYSDCAQRLRCNIESCDTDPMTGENTCTGTCADPCASDGPCAGGCGDDAWCDFETNTCQPLPHTGEPCNAAGLCHAPDFCALDPDDPTITRCFAPAALGDPCMGHSQCESGYCPAGACAELPQKGESCAGTFACARGLQCDNASMKCVVADALVCQQSPGLSNGY